MKRRLEYQDAKSHKFWEIRVKGRSHTVRYGKVGRDGQERTKEFDSPAEAKAQAEKLLAAKLKKGYREESDGETAPTKKKSASKRKRRAPRPEERFQAHCLAQPKAYVAEWHDGNRITDRTSYRIKQGDHREFAIWVPDGEQPGMHLRYSDPAELKDWERSTAHRGKKHNWMYLGPDSDDWDRTGELVAASHATAQKRGGGATTGKAQLYKPLADAMALALEDHRPSALHAGGPAAKILGKEGPAAFRLGLWSAEQVQHLVPKTEATAFRGTLKALHEALDLYHRLISELPDEQVRMGDGYRQLSARGGELSSRKDGESLAAQVLAAAKYAFCCIPGGYSQRATSALGTATTCAVKALEAAGDAEGIRAYLAELDERILGEELLAAAASKAKLDQPPALEKVLWRGADSKGYPAYWIARVEGQYGLLGKLGRRWTWTQGNRDEVLGSVPDEHFEVATEWVLRRDG